MAGFDHPFDAPFDDDEDAILIPLELYDPIAGNRGLRGGRVLLNLEEPDGVMPSDASGNLADLTADTGTTVPPSTSSWTGRGRAFDSSDTNALIASDIDGRDTLLQRDITVQMIVAINIPEGDEDPRTLIARGIDGSAAQYRSARLVVQRSGDSDALVSWEWQDSAGVSKSQASGEFQLLGAGKFMLLTATRRWEASDKVVVRYYVDERLIGEVESEDGDIGGGTTGQTTIGGLKSGGVWSEFFDGVIDELAIYDYEMSPAEVRAVWLRLYKHQPEGVETLKGLSPPGAPWFKDPSNRIGRRMKVVGQALGGAAAVADELREMFLPDKAPSDQLARWEEIYELSARTHDSLDLRRERLLGIAGREEGFSKPAVLEALLESLDVTDPDDLEIVEGSNLVTDDFATTIHDERWLRDGAWSIVAGELHVSVPIASDVSWDASRWGAHMRTSLDVGELGVHTVATKLVDWSLPANAGAGILLADRRLNDALWFGVYNDGGTIKLGYRLMFHGVVDAFVPIVNAGAAPYWLRVRQLTAIGSPETFYVDYSQTSETADDFVETEITTSMLYPDWGGYGVFGTSTNLAAELTADFDDFSAFCPGGTRPFHWYVYRNPALGGSPDMIGANRLVQRLKPAHTHAAAIESKSVLAGNERFGLAGRGPMGALRSL